MRKIYLMIPALLLALSAGAEYKPGYYNQLDGKKRETLKAAAKTAVKNHTTLQYYELPEYWQYSDVYPDLVDGCRRWWDMYSDALYLIRQGQGGKSSFSANKMQREHSVPKSWWKLNGSVEYTPAYSDMWNLYPSDAAANQAKLNYPFGVTQSASFNNGVTKVGPAANGYGGGCPYVFEPADEYKGDFARAVFYMATVYDDINWVINYMFVKESYPGLQTWAVNMLLDWARKDRVSQKEIDRNNVVEQYQGNRNPFVDFPELAEYIWGSRTSQTFYLSEQEGSDPTPPITGDPEITSPINGESLDFGQTAVGNVVSRVLQIAGRNLTESLSVRIVGTDASLFTPEVRSIPALTMNQNQGYLLNIAYQPQSVGRHEARVVLYDGGLDESIAVTLQAEALERPELGTIHALEAVIENPTTYTAQWEAAPGVADYYIVTRIREMEGNQETETYETGETSYTFTDRDPEVGESYYVTYSRLGLTSEPSNTIYVAPGSGVEEIGVDAPVRLLNVKGGVMVRTSEGKALVKICTLQGILIYEGEAADGEIIQLPAGIYVATGPGMRAKKLIVD